MKSEAYHIEEKVTKNHWWFNGRKKLFIKVISKLNVDRNAKFLDIGVSTGSNLDLLRELGYKNIQGIDISKKAINICKIKGFKKVKLDNICNCSFKDNSFDFIFATDVLEHVNNDLVALQEIKRILKPNGKVLIVVPAFNFLWGSQDDISLHKRRYRIGSLFGIVNRARLKVIKYYYFNYILFFPILICRKIIKIFKINIRSENQLNLPILNRVLSYIFTLDISFAEYLNVPFGVSALVVAEKR